mgnify:CR=1 FL=1
MSEENVKSLENLDEAEILEDEKELVLDHNYDGIKELDHPLPYWWLVTFYLGIIFAILYSLYFFVGGGPSLKENYQKELAQLNQLKQKRAAELGGFNAEVFLDWKEKSENKLGHKVFQTNCTACHLEKGVGDIGPNLTDDHWLVAKGDPQSIYKIIVEGSMENGMPPWKEILTHEEMHAVTAYVRSLHGYEGEEEKEKEGEYIDPQSYTLK